MINWEELFGPNVWQTLSPSDRADLVVFVERSISANYAAFSVFTWTLYDTVLTFGRETRYVWSRHPSATTLIYVINRYLFIAVIALTLAQAVYAMSDSSCQAQGITTLVVSFLVYISQASFSALRLYAIWGHNLKLAIFVFALHTPPLVLGILWSPLRQPHGSFAIEYFPGCYQEFNSSYMTAYILRRVMTLITDIIVLALTWAKTYSIRREARDFGMNVPISMLLLRDGTLHFSVFLGLSILDLTMASMASTIVVDYATLYLQVFRSITVCHFILHLREVYLAGSGASTHSAIVSSILQFASQAVGNLGAPLDFSDMDDDEAEEARSSSEWVSRNPLAAGLPMMSAPDADEAEERDSMSTASTIELKDLFDDDSEEYAHRYLSLVRRKGTGDESCEDGKPPEAHALLGRIHDDDTDDRVTQNANDIAVRLS